MHKSSFLKFQSALNFITKTIFNILMNSSDFFLPKQSIINALQKKLNGILFPVHFERDAFWLAAIKKTSSVVVFCDTPKAPP